MTKPVPTTYQQICKRLVFKPMCDKKRTRLESYTATANALQAATGLPHAPSRDALQMWVRETGLVGAMVYRYYEVTE